MRELHRRMLVDEHRESSLAPLLARGVVFLIILILSIILIIVL